MKYRGFIIKTKIFQGEIQGNHKYDVCEVDIFKKINESESELLEEVELYREQGSKDTLEQYFNERIVKFIDEKYADLVSESGYHQYSRKMELLGKTMCWIGETESGADLYNTFSHVIGFTDDEIRELGFTSLIQYFDKEKYAATIADYLVVNGTEETFSGNYHIEFSEINKRFGTNLPEDKEMLDKIAEQLTSGENSLVVSDLNMDTDIDINFYTLYCPNVIEEDCSEGFIQTM